jgi:hypothetical protein
MTTYRNYRLAHETTGEQTVWTLWATTKFPVGDDNPAEWEHKGEYPSADAGHKVGLWLIGQGPKPEEVPVLWGPAAEATRQAYLRRGVRPFFHEYLRGSTTEKLVECVEELVTVDPDEFADSIALLRLEIAFRGDGPCEATPEGCAQERAEASELEPGQTYCPEHEGMVTT